MRKACPSWMDSPWVKPAPLLWLLLAGCSPSDKDPAQEVFERASPSIAKVYGLSSVPEGNRAGTGFATRLAGRLVIVTNRHVVEKAEVAVVESAGGIWSSPLWKEHEHLDIAILEIPDGTDMPSLNLGSAKDMTPGKKVYTVGYPLGESLAVQEGIVSSVEGSSLVFSAPLSTGASGSPLLDSSARVIGLCHSFVPDAQNYNLALPADFLELASSWKERAPLPEPELKGYLERLASVKSAGRKCIESWEAVAAEYPEWEEWVEETDMTRRQLVRDMESAVSAANAIDWGSAISASDRQTSGAMLARLLEKNALSLEGSWGIHLSNLEKAEPAKPVPSSSWMPSDQSLVPDLIASLRRLAGSLKPSGKDDGALPDSSELEEIASILLAHSEIEKRWEAGLVP